MAKPQKRNMDEPISISRIYEEIKARDFIQDLWSDIIADIQEKPTYKRIKNMVNALINNTIEEFSDEPQSEAERVKRRTMLTEISIMTYTVDTIISELLSKKLLNEFQLIIENVVKDVKADIDIKPSHTAVAGPSKVQDEKAESEPQPTSILSKRVALNSSILNSTLKSDTSPKKRGRPRKYPIQDPKPKTSPLRKRGRPRKNIAMDGAEESSGLSQQSSAEKPEPVVFLNNGFKDHNQDNGYDAAFDDSDGELSMTSVSSVHTSELSSFEDTISIDGDGDKKQQIPLKVANEMYLKGTLSEVYRKKAKKRKRSNKVKAKVTDHCSLSDSSSASQKCLPPRIRKPNSKYSSDIVFCEAFQSTSPLQKNKIETQSKPSPKKLSSNKVLSANSSPEKTVSPKRKITFTEKKKSLMELITISSSEEE